MKSQVGFFIDKDDKIIKGEVVFFETINERWYRDMKGKAIFNNKDFNFYGDVGRNIFKTRKAAKDKIEQEKRASLKYYQKQLKEAKEEIANLETQVR